MSCPFIDKRYGHNLCSVTDDYIEWENYSDVCSSSCSYEDCGSYKKDEKKLKSYYFVTAYKMK
jgi:hypothetical protein